MLPILNQFKILEYVIADISKRSYLEYKADREYNELYFKFLTLARVSTRWFSFIQNHRNISFRSITITKAFKILNKESKLNFHYDSNLYKFKKTNTIRKISMKINGTKQDKLYPFIKNINFYFPKLQSLTIDFRHEDSISRGFSEYHRQLLDVQFDCFKKNIKKIEEDEKQFNTFINNNLVREKEYHEKEYINKKILLSLPEDISIHLHLHGNPIINILSLFTEHQYTNNNINIDRLTINSFDLVQYHNWQILEHLEIDKESDFSLLKQLNIKNLRFQGPLLDVDYWSFLDQDLKYPFLSGIEQISPNYFNDLKTLSFRTTIPWPTVGKLLELKSLKNLELGLTFFRIPE